jgi:hypothetical protein
MRLREPRSQSGEQKNVLFLPGLNSYFSAVQPVVYRNTEHQSPLVVDPLIGKDLNGSGSGRIVILSQHFPGGTEKNYEISQSG